MSNEQTAAALIAGGIFLLACVWVVFFRRDGRIENILADYEERRKDKHNAQDDDAW